LLPQLNKDKRYARQEKETATIKQEEEEADAQGYKWEG
jgi:hypothetical protein